MEVITMQTKQMGIQNGMVVRKVNVNLLVKGQRIKVGEINVPEKSMIPNSINESNFVSGHSGAVVLKSNKFKSGQVECVWKIKNFEYLPYGDYHALFELMDIKTGEKNYYHTYFDYYNYPEDVMELNILESEDAEKEFNKVSKSKSKLSFESIMEVLFGY